MINWEKDVDTDPATTAAYAAATAQVAEIFLAQPVEGLDRLESLVGVELVEPSKA